jgi:hypothetical protein
MNVRQQLSVRREPIASRTLATAISKIGLTFRLFRPILRPHLAAGSMDPVTSLSLLDPPASFKRLEMISGHPN